MSYVISKSIYGVRYFLKAIDPLSDYGVRGRFRYQWEGLITNATRFEHIGKEEEAALHFMEQKHFIHLDIVKINPDGRDISNTDRGDTHREDPRGGGQSPQDI